MATTWTTITYSGTNWRRLEPWGFGVSPFGDPSTGVEEGIKIHMRGFGDPSTFWTDETG